MKVWVEREHILAWDYMYYMQQFDYSEPCNVSARLLLHLRECFPAVRSALLCCVQCRDCLCALREIESICEYYVAKIVTFTAFSKQISDCGEKGNTVAMHVIYVALQIVFSLS